MKRTDVERYVPESAVAESPRELLDTLLVVHERLVNDRLAGLAAAGREEAEATQRALAGILIDTLEERDELQRIRDAWETGEAARPPPPSRMEYRDRLESLLEAKRVMARRYRNLAAAAPDAGLAKRLRRLGERSGEHAAILLSLLGQ